MSHSVELLKLSQIVPSSIRNFSLIPLSKPRTTELAQSMAELDVFVPPFVEHVAAGKYELLAGSTRFNAMAEQGITECYCVVFDGKATPMQRVRIMAEENRRSGDILQKVELVYGAVLAVEQEAKQAKGNPVERAIREKAKHDGTQNTDALVADLMTAGQPMGHRFAVSKRGKLFLENFSKTSAPIYGLPPKASDARESHGSVFYTAEALSYLLGFGAQGAKYVRRCLEFLDLRQSKDMTVPQVRKVTSEATFNEAKAVAKAKRNGTEVTVSEPKAKSALDCVLYCLKHSHTIADIESAWAEYEAAQSDEG